MSIRAPGRSFSPYVRKIALTAHVLLSVGWVGAVAAFLTLAMVGLSASDPLRVRAVYIAMDVVTTFMIVPLCLAAFASGVLMSLGTAWGLLRHYWVVFKLALTLGATGLLLLHRGPITLVAREAMSRPLQPGDLRDVRIQLVADAAAALVVLGAVTVLSVFKPKGVTRLGHRAAGRSEPIREASRV